MNKRNFNVAVGVTILWLVGIFGIYLFDLFERPTTFNELGDFLAGVFSPIAFLWLILGYIQQGKQLEQNTRALEQQEEALKLQIDEMRESVTQQKELVDGQKQQFEAMNNSVEPNFSFKNIDIYFCGLSSENGKRNEPEYGLTFHLKNMGHEIKNFKCLNHLNRVLYSLERVAEDDVEVNISVFDLELEWKGDYLTSKINLQFKNIYGKSEAWIYILKLRYVDKINYKIDLPNSITIDLIEKSPLS